MPSPRPTPATAGAPQAAWQGSGRDVTLHLAGDFEQHAPKLPPPPQGVAAVAIDAAGLTGWDARFAAALWQLLSQLRGAGTPVDLDGLPPGLQQIMGLALPADDAPPKPPRDAAPPHWVARVGARAAAWWLDARLTLAFVGDVLIATGAVLRGKGDLRLADLAWQVQETGPKSVPIVSLVSLMVGLILAYMGGAQLANFGAKSFVADLMAVSVVREIGALLTGIILSGRVGAAFAAQLGSMRANDELDALRTLGIDPVSHLVLPRALALVLVAPLLTAYAAVVGLLIGLGAATLIYGVTPAEYIARTFDALSLPHVLVGLLKGTVYGLLVALAGCRQGLHAGKSAQAVGDATTQAVVKSIVWIVCSASILTVIFQRLGV